MELLVLAFAGAASIAAAILAFIFPGFGVMQAMWIGKAIGMIYPPALGVIIPLTYAISSAIQSLKEAHAPALAGNHTVHAALAGGMSNFLNKSSLEKSLVIAKATGWTIGIGLGLALAGFSSSFPSIVTMLVLIFILIRLAPSTEGAKGWGILLAYIVGTQVAFSICNFFNLANPIYVIGSIVFLLPAALERVKVKKDEEQTEGESEGIIPPNPITCVIGGAISFLTPGINANAITMGMNNNSNSYASLISSVATETAIEAVGLVMLGKGVVSGKAILPVELGDTLAFPSYGLVLCTLIFFIAPLAFPLLMAIANRVRMSKKMHETLHIMGALGILVAVTGANVLALSILIPLGLAINACGKRLSTGGRSLLFIGGVL